MNTIKYFDTISNNENVPNYTIIEILKTMCKDIDMQEISLIQVNKVTDTTYSLNIQLKNGKVITSNTFELAQGPQGEAGPQGPEGPQGPVGPQGIGFNFKTTPYVNNNIIPYVNQVIKFTQKPTFVNDVSTGDPVALIYTNNDTSYLCIGTITRWIFLQYQITLTSVNLISSPTTAINQTLPFMTDTYVETTDPALNDTFSISDKTFTENVDIYENFGFVWKNSTNGNTFLCFAEKLNSISAKITSIAQLESNLVVQNTYSYLFGEGRVLIKPQQNVGIVFTSYDFNKSFSEGEEGLFIITHPSTGDYNSVFIVIGTTQSDGDASGRNTNILCKYVYDVSNYMLLDKITFNDIQSVQYSDDNANITGNFTLTNTTNTTTIVGEISLPLKAGPNTTINADETGKSIVITSSANIASFDSLSDLYTFINQPSIVPLRLLVSLPDISGTFTQIDTNISTNTTTASQEEGYQYFVGREWNIVITEHGPSALAGLSLDISANFPTTFHFAGTALNVYQYSTGYSENLIQSFIFQGILTSLSPTSIKLYYTETT